MAKKKQPTLKITQIKSRIGYKKKAKATLDAMGIKKMNWEEGKQYDALITADDVVEGRPHPAMILEAMKRLNVKDASQVLKAGDSIIDIEEGKNAHCGVTIGVTTGAHTGQQLESAKPTYVVRSLTELEQLVNA